MIDIAFLCSVYFAPVKNITSRNSIIYIIVTSCNM